MSKAKKNKEIIRMKDFFNVVRFIFKTVGVRVSEKPDAETNLEANSVLLFALLNLVFAMVGEQTFLAKAFSDGRAKFVQSIYLIVCNVFMYFAMFKILVLRLYDADFARLIRDLNENFPNTSDQQLDFEIHQHAKRVQSFNIFYTVVQLFMASCFNIFPAVEIFQKLYREGKWEIDFAFPITYPFDPYRRGIFEYCYFNHWYASYVTIVCVISVDMLMFICLEQICMHFYQLTRSIQRFETFDPQNEKLFIKQHVKKHDIIIE